MTATYIQQEDIDHVRVLRLSRGKSNAMHLEMIEELAAAIEAAANDPAVESLLLTGKDGFFSSGLDLITLYAYNEEEIKRFWQHFMDLIYQLASFPKPSLAAISGHSPAGGCVLALCCDYRIMAVGDFIIGLNEVAVGIVVPRSIFELYSFWLGSATAYRLLLTGKLLTVEEAVTVGLVDQSVPADRIETAGLRQLKSLMQYERHAWRQSKLNLRKGLLQHFKDDRDHAIDQVLTQWWRPSTRAVLKTIIENLTTKKK